MNVLESLKAMRELLTPATWTKGRCAKNALGQAITATHPDACQWCLLGAAMKVTDYDDVMVSKTLDSIRSVIGNVPVPVFNDSSTFGQVASALDDAIAKESLTQ